MTLQHLLYIPTVFLLGLVFGTMLPRQTAIFSSEPSSLRGKLFQSFLIFLLVFVITHVFEIPGGAKSIARHLGGTDLFDKRPSFSATDVYERIMSFTEYGIATYKRFTYTIDFIFPISFFFFLFTFAQFVKERIPLPKYLNRLLLSLSVAWLVSDLIENAIIFSLLSLFPGQHYILASSLGIVTTVKFILLAISVLAPGIVLISHSLIASIRIKST